METKVKPAPFLHPLFAFMERWKAGLHAQPAGLSESLRMFSAVILRAIARTPFPRKWPCGTFNLRWNLWNTYQVREGLFFLQLFPGICSGSKKIRSYLWPLKCQGTNH